MAFSGETGTSELEQRHQVELPDDSSVWQGTIDEHPRREEVFEDLAYFKQRYDEEMLAARKARDTRAKAAHFELAYNYAVRLRDLRTATQLR